MKAEQDDDSHNGMLAGIVRGIGKFPKAISLARKAFAHRLVGQIPSKLPVQKIAKFSDLTSFLLDLRSSFHDALNMRIARKENLSLLRAAAFSMARSTILGTASFLSFEKASEMFILTQVEPKNNALSLKGDAPVPPYIWFLSSVVAGSAHGIVGLAWDAIFTSKTISGGAIRVALTSSIASHSCLFTTYFMTKTFLLSRLGCDISSPTGVFSVAAAGAAAGAVTHIPETLVPDEPAARPSQYRSLWAEARRRTRLLSMGAALRAAPATVVAFVAYEFADAG